MDQGTNEIAPVKILPDICIFKVMCNSILFPFKRYLLCEKPWRWERERASVARHNCALGQRKVFKRIQAWMVVENNHLRPSEPVSNEAEVLWPGGKPSAESGHTLLLEPEGHNICFNLEHGVIQGDRRLKF